MIIESIKKITSPNKRLNLNSPMKDLKYQDEIRFLQNENKNSIPLKDLLFNKNAKNNIDFDT